MTMHNSQTLPITMAHAHRDVLPHAYVIRVRQQRCKCCNALSQFSELYAKTHLRSQLGLGKYITNLRPLMPEGPLYDLPIERELFPVTEIPFCHNCNHPTLHDLPPLPQPPDHLRIVGAPNDPKSPAKGGSTATATKTATATRSKPTKDDLLF